jgi:hypothetical protein
MAAGAVVVVVVEEEAVVEVVEVEVEEVAVARARAVGGGGWMVGSAGGSRRRLWRIAGGRHQAPLPRCGSRCSALLLLPGRPTPMASGRGGRRG